ncbi:MAG TPA: MFS transporter [Mycobacteriales bacterium]|nr:MFS transporter [Mycobacteriales bacterium]
MQTLAGDRAALGLLFGVFGFTQGSWAARVPWIAGALDLSPGALGLALLGPAVGGLLAMPLAPLLVARWGTRGTAAAAVGPLGLALGALAWSPDLGTLAVALTAFGLVGGVLDVAANAHGVAVEEARGRPVMSGLHGGWSLGALSGAATGGLVAQAGIGAPAHLAVAGVASGLAGVALARRLHRTATPPARGPVFALPSRGTLLLGLIAFGSMFAEAGVADWSAVFLTTSRDAGPGLAAAGFAAFSVCMAAGRFVGDAVVHRSGPRRVLVGSAAVAAGGLALAVAVPHPVAAVAGFAVAGCGTACLVPVVFSSAGRAEPDPHRRPHAMAAVVTTGYLGWLAAPPTIGAVAQLTTVGSGLAVAAGLTAAAAALAFVTPVTRRSPVPRADPGVPH